ncbi:MAG: polysaccharide deacetylase family protein [Cellulomonadaceae bacterium]|nr:polysaccharide deacetylase family protein [Cellulomonadaceae bacterium]
MFPAVPRALTHTRLTRTALNRTVATRTAATRSVATRSVAGTLSALLSVVSLAVEPAAQVYSATADLTLVSQGVTAQVTPAELFEALDLTRDSATGKYSVAWNADALDAHLATLAQDFHIPARPTLVLDDQSVVREGVPGRFLDPDQVRESATSILNNRLTFEHQDFGLGVLPGSVEEPEIRVIFPGAFDGPDTVHLTFDDGPGLYTDKILDVLKEFDVRATFYVLGSRVEAYAEQIERIVSEGHRIGNHSWSHTELTTLTYKEILKEIEDTQQAIFDLTGHWPTAFRPPYGSVNKDVHKAAKAAGVSVDLWDVDPRDWAGEVSAEGLAGRVVRRAHPGDVVLLHVTKRTTLAALPLIVEGFRGCDESNPNHPDHRPDKPVKPEDTDDKEAMDAYREARDEYKAFDACDPVGRGFQLD